MSYGANNPSGVPLGLPSIVSLGLAPLVNPYPALNLDFINNQTLDPRITFSRGSQATLFDSTGALRYAKHNLFTYSQGFDDSSWTKNNSATVTANAGVAPDGTTTADQFNGAAIVSSGVFKFPSGAQSGVACTFSLYVKNVSAATTLQLGCDANPSNAAVVFNAVTGVITSVGANVTSSSVINAGNGWYRVIVNFTTTSTGPGFVIYSNSLSVATWLVWGAQLNIANMEGGVTSSLTTYYPTTTAAYYAPRFDYNPSTLQPLGLLIEEQRTNSIRNNTMQGAVAGSPGTAPTNWTSPGSGVGLTQEIVGVGTENGITYLDIKVSGTPSISAAFDITPEPTNQVVAANGQTWTHSCYVKLQAGAVTNAVVSIFVFGRTSAGGFIGGQSNETIFTPTSAALSGQRQTVTFTMSDATVAYAQPRIRITYTSGNAIDITLRIGLPQLELGAFATSVIPTTTTALTRNADVASMTGTNFSSWYNASEGTVFGEYQTVSAGTTQFLAAITSVSETDRITLGQTTTTYVGTVVDTGSTQASITQGTTSLNVAKISLAYAVNNFAFSANGAAPNTDTSGTVPSGVTEMKLGRRGTSTSPLNGWISRIAYYPTRLPNATLQALTA